ncbi:hypothetical protein IG631_05637 [Alternaria alternata]|nr:hypothetical protein IG631_05637 [Alternaria alternata]
MAMTSAHGSRYHRADTNTSFAQHPSNFENDSIPFDPSREHGYNSDYGARHCNTGGTDSFHCDDEQPAIGLSPNSTVVSVEEIAIGEVSRTSKTARSSPSTTNTSSGEGPGHNGPQDVRLDAFSQIHLITRTIVLIH